MKKIKQIISELKLIHGNNKGKPKLFKDGKRLDSESMTSFDIDWACDRAVDITVRNE